jgi:predicted Zn-dependent protease with MMP-like domain
MNRVRFEQVVEEALTRVPRRFRERLQNLAIVVEDEPALSHLQSGRVPRGHTLLGLYEGVPLSKRGWANAPPMPDRIWLFQGPIERSTDGSDAAIAHQAAETLFHELGHYFGLNEFEVRRAERRRRKWKSPHGEGELPS